MDESGVYPLPGNCCNAATKPVDGSAGDDTAGREFPNTAAAASKTSDVGGIALGGGRDVCTTNGRDGETVGSLEGTGGLGGMGTFAAGGKDFSSRLTYFTPGATSGALDSGTDKPGPNTTPRNTTSEFPTLTLNR